MINLKIDKNEPDKFILRIFYIGILNESPTNLLIAFSHRVKVIISFHLKLAVTESSFTL